MKLEPFDSEQKIGRFPIFGGVLNDIPFTLSVLIDKSGVVFETNNKSYKLLTEDLVAIIVKEVLNAS